jgi:hypothetical protein
LGPQPAISRSPFEEIAANDGADLHPFATSSVEVAALHREPPMQSVRAMREEVGTPSVPDGAGWSRIVFIAVGCALAGIGFLAATVVINGRALSFVGRSAATHLDLQPPTSATAPDPPPKAPAKPRPPANDRFQPVDFLPRAEINKATLARCRSHVEAARTFEGLSPRRVAEIREERKPAERDPEAICREYLTTESGAGR